MDAEINWESFQPKHPGMAQSNTHTVIMSYVNKQKIVSQAETWNQNNFCLNHVRLIWNHNELIAQVRQTRWEPETFYVKIVQREKIRQTVPLPRFGLVPIIDVLAHDKNWAWLENWDGQLFATVQCVAGTLFLPVIQTNVTQQICSLGIPEKLGKKAAMQIIAEAITAEKAQL